ncbi:MAG: cyclopropane-fatty-acyl-phospholipid synthase [Frankiales bacterium]|nr:cyclopropane-fatty-acyl-phospholipid synthase [Frankiales bacterium]
MTTTAPATALVPAGTRQGAAQELAALIEPLFGGTLPVRLRAWDGSETGPVGAPVVVLRSRRAVRRLMFHPDELGLAQAYVTGELDVEGDLADGLRRVWQALRDHEGQTRARLTGAEKVQALRTAARLGILGLPPKAPQSQARLRGRLHSLRRDRAAISHHYDLSNDFYALILDPQMAYSCAYYTSDDPSYTLEDAQRAKLDLIARKLDVRPGSRHLDIGCGWGSLSLHLAQEYGAQVLGVTLSGEQKAFIDARIAERGLQDLVEVRLQDYREVPESGFDTVSSIEMGEHVGAANYPVFAGIIQDKLRPAGRALVQQMSRRDRPGGGDFIEAYIAPDMHMRPVGETVALLEDAGLEVRDVHAMREHYVTTVRAWYDTFEAHWAEAVDLVGEEVARVWRLYLVGGGLVFEEGRMGVDQLLAVKRQPSGFSGMPPTRTGFEPAGQGGTGP